MKKVLFVENHKGFCKFLAPYYRWFEEQGWQVDHAAPGIEKGFDEAITNQWDIDIHRSPFSLANIKAIFDLKRIIKREKYDLIHCHTEMGGFCARVAAWGTKKGDVRLYILRIIILSIKVLH